jgi:hypothetical protein
MASAALDPRVFGGSLADEPPMNPETTTRDLPPLF